MPEGNSPTPLSQQLERRTRELEAARKISEALFQQLTVQELVEQALKTALEVVKGQAGSVLLANPESKELVFYHAIGEKAPKPGTALPWDQGIAGSVYQSGEVMVIGDVKKDSRHFSKIDKATGFTTHDMIALPLKRWEGNPIGVLCVMNKKGGELDKDDVGILTIISAFAALTIEQARLFEESKLAEVARVLGDIGHDIKNMLMPVLCGASLLKEEFDECFNQLVNLDIEKATVSHRLFHELIEMVKTNSYRIQERVKEIADCVKGMTTPPKFGPCTLKEVVKVVIETLRVLAEEKGVALETRELDSLPVIQADERRLFNAFYNLVHNAIPEVPRGGSVTISGEREPSGDGIIVRVADTGRGMPDDVRESLFSARAISRKPGGTGLGTKIVRDVVNAHGGQITVDSEENKGTTFTLRLPINQPTKPQ